MRRLRRGFRQCKFRRITSSRRSCWKSATRIKMEGLIIRSLGSIWMIRSWNCTGFFRRLMWSTTDAFCLRSCGMLLSKLIEYDVESCGVNGAEMNGCIHSKSVSVRLPCGGDMIYGVGHQHAGGTGTTLYGEGGRVICLSNPSYGNGNDAGNEAGYIVGMSTCYPSRAKPVKIGAGETLTLVSNYSSKGGHAGVMGLFYLLLAESSPELSSHTNVMTKVRDITMVPKCIWSAVVLVAGLTGIVIIVSKGRNGRAEGYEAMS